MCLALATGCGAGDVSLPVGNAGEGQPGNAFRPQQGEISALPVDPAVVQANELGLVPVLMYHRIVDQPSSVYDRTPADFRAELERLAREGYVPVRASDYATGRMNVPAGKHPVVLTFDDSSTSQFTLGPDGQPAPNTAVAILLEVARQYPGFTPTATFYVNASPFNDADGARTLRWLHDNGFEIGNHTFGHANLRAASDQRVQEEIVKAQQMIQNAVPEAEVRTLALPFGIHPKKKELARAGSADGVSYEHHGVMLVGANPAPSPYATTFDPLNIPRIRSQGTTGDQAFSGSTAWLDKLASGELPRYTSDGDPRTISFPKRMAEVLRPELQQKARPY